MFKKQAFTLAEVLITLAVIGIVAALTIGVFLPKIHSQIRSRQVATAEVKFTKAMEQMALNNAIGPYYETTQEFVDELQNYLKISKVCDDEHFEDCFGYDKMYLANGEEFELADIKTGKNLGKNEDYLETVGLVTIDGTGMIVSWNKKCDILEPKVYQWGGNTNETTSCVAMLMDVNLDKSPNRLNKDVALFRANSPDLNCSVQFNYNGKKYCWGTPFWTSSSLSHDQCMSIKDEMGINNCRDDNHDNWAHAVYTCGGIAKMPSREDLSAFAGYLYNKTGAIGVSDAVSGTLDSSKLPSSFPTGGFRLWSNAEGGKGAAHTRIFGESSSSSAYDATQGSFLAVCKIK